MSGNIISIENLSMHFGGLKAVDELSFSVKEREIFGLIGPNGAGKTTVFNCITQFYKPKEGRVMLKTADGSEMNLVGLPAHKVIRLGVVRTFQNVEVIRELSLLDNVLVGAHIKFKATMLEQALQLPRARREEKIMAEEAKNALDFFDIADRMHMPAGGQPYGVLKKVELARTLMSNPRLIIMDEPAAGLNETETEALADSIRKIRAVYDCAILLVEHDMRLVMGLCDRVCCISFGKFIALGTPAEVQADKNVQEAYLGGTGEEEGDGLE